jgi:Na+-translocating ferredoxin:NAD+ oxidoreductase RnfA subunit
MSITWLPTIVDSFVFSETEQEHVRVVVVTMTISHSVTVTESVTVERNRTAVNWFTPVVSYVPFYVPVNCFTLFLVPVQTEEPPNGTPSNGVIIGVATGVAVVVALLAGIAITLVRMNRRANEDDPAAGKAEEPKKGGLIHPRPERPVYLETAQQPISMLNPLADDGYTGI